MRRIVLAVLLAIAEGGCSSPETTTDGSCQLVESGFGPDGNVPIQVDVVASGLEVPWSIAFLPEGDLLVTERPGRVRIVTMAGELRDPVASPQITSTSAEGGLLGLALHPDFASNGVFYVYVTSSTGGQNVNHVERWTLAADRTKATFDKIIFDGISGAEFHDGGRLRFGPDGMLYVGTGDGRSPDRSQDPDSPSGKILRLTPDGEVPGDNPLAGNPAFILGIRNTQGFDWLDPETMIITDHGPSGEYMDRQGHDEVNVAKAGDNLGWPTWWSCEKADGFVTPSITWQEALPPGGAALYHGSAIPEWKGALVIGALRSEHLQVVHLDTEDRRRVVAHEVYLAGAHGRLRDVIMGPDGHLYVTTSNCDGRGACGPEKDQILRIHR
jgi:glucose/arabinose dehydrogenase